jgi:hypothetical protein
LDESCLEKCSITGAEQRRIKSIPSIAPDQSGSNEFLIMDGSASAKIFTQYAPIIPTTTPVQNIKKYIPKIIFIYLSFYLS